MAKSIVTNEDNMVMMARYPDKYFDLAIVDPPYGIGIDGQKKSVNKNANYNRKYHEPKLWDKKIPDISYFNELFRVSKNQVIWGGNYFTEHLSPTKSWIFWYKGQNGLTMSDGELAWTSFKTVTRQIEINRGWVVMEGNTIHPTQKTIKLYNWILQNYAKSNDKILDTHLGSGSSRLAAYDLGFDFYGCELDKDYFDAQEKRFSKHISQQKLFTPQQQVYEQTTLL